MCIAHEHATYLAVLRDRIAELEADVEHLEDVDSKRCRRLAARVKELEAENEVLKLTITSHQCTPGTAGLMAYPIGPADIGMVQFQSVYDEEGIVLWRKADK